MARVPFTFNKNGTPASFIHRVSNPKTASHFFGNALSAVIKTLSQPIAIQKRGKP
jgi:hypothetical protein